MKIRIFPAAELPAEHLARWSRLQTEQVSLTNPFFRPEFTQAVASVRDDVQVAVLEEDHEPVGFLPFEHVRRLGKPVGSHINEFQGAIARPNLAWCPQQVVRAAGLRAWAFDHLVTTQMAFGPFHYLIARSPYIDVSGGFDRYLKSGSKSTANQVGDAQRRERKAKREIGEVRVEINPAGAGALEQLLEWKTEQCRRTHRPCIYGAKWTVDLFKRLLEYNSSDFTALLICLFIGDRLAAGSFALRCRNVLHEVIGGFDTSLSQYSPGSILEVHLAKMALSIGVTRIDLGKGDEPYKVRYASGFDQVAEGAVHARRLHGPVYRAWFHTRDRLRSSWLRGPVLRVRRWTLAARISLTGTAQ